MEEHFVPEGVFQKAVIFNSEEKVLLLRPSFEKYGQDSRRWDLPGGKVHLDESLKEAVLREVKEETSVDLKDIQLFDADIEKFVRSDGKTRIGLIYFAEIEGDVQLSHEHIAYDWVDITDIRNRNFTFTNAGLWIEKAAKLRKKMRGR